jgi:hypothetical protein
MRRAGCEIAASAHCTLIPEFSGYACRMRPYGSSYSPFARSLGHRFGARAAPCGSAFRTRVPRPPGFGLLPLAGSGSPSNNFFSWQRGYAATWEQRTFAPFGRYTAARQMTNGSTIVVPAMSQSFGHSGASCFVIWLPSHPERQPSPSSRRVHPLKCRWRCRRRCDSQATQR